MKYVVVVHFNDLHDETFNVDYYTHVNGILELFNYDVKNTKIKVFSLDHVASIDITQIGE